MEQYYNYLQKSEISPSGVEILYCLKNKRKPSPFTNKGVEMVRLETKGFVLADKITPKGNRVLRELQKYFRDVKVDKTGWEEKIIQFNELFPKGKRPNTTHYYRSNPKSLEERFEWFFLEFPEYNWDIVLKTTKVYINSFKQSGDYTFCNKSMFFIKKLDKSDGETKSKLSEMCYNVLEGNDDDLTSGTHYYE